jgi:flavin reductase (DIM6/NTAB) family NADH-FMN oxidoreductase RutF
MPQIEDFIPVKRQQFRRWFQPSRIALCVLPEALGGGFNVITLCFTMYCSYKPPMLAMAIHNINRTYELIEKTSEYVLAVPGEDMVGEAVFCGTHSARDRDKILAMGIKFSPSQKIGVPGLAKAIANVEMVKHTTVITGDHALVVGRAVNFRVRRGSEDALPLVSIGPNLCGYRLLAHLGIHRIATVKR